MSEPSPKVGTGLLVYGIVLILAGAGAALLAAITLLYAAASMLHPEAELAITPRAAAPSLLTYTATAALLVWLGIGSIRRRRWARQLIVVVAWLGLLSGLANLVVIALVFSPLVTMMADLSGLPPLWVAVVTAALSAALAALTVVLPGLMIVYYRRPEVVAACAAAGPERQWSDGLSAHALSLAAVALLIAFTFLLLPLHGLPVPLFGLLVTGWPGLGLCLLGILACLGLARGTLRHDLAAWRWGVAATVLAALASTVTFAVVEPTALVADLAMTAEEVAMVTAAAATLTRSQLVVASLLTWLSLLAYQLWVRREVTTPRHGGAR